MRFTEQEIEIRIIDEDSLSAARDFLLQQCRELYGREFQSAKNQDIWNLQEVYLNTAGNIMLGAFLRGGNLVGTAAACAYNDRIAAVKGRYGLDTTAEIARCYIDKTLRRRGIGSLLVQKVQEFCFKQGYRTLYLHTHKFLPGGFSFWQSQGFAIVIEEYGPDETVHMEKCWQRFKK